MLLGSGLQAVQIPVFNEFDAEPPPTNFTYVRCGTMTDNNRPPCLCHLLKPPTCALAQALLCLDSRAAKLSLMHYISSASSRGGLPSRHHFINRLPEGSLPSAALQLGRCCFCSCSSLAMFFPPSLLRHCMQVQLHQQPRGWGAARSSCSTDARRRAVVRFGAGGGSGAELLPLRWHPHFH